MSDTTLLRPSQKAPKSTVAFWKCENCESLMSIESLRPVFITVCPVCQGTPLDLRARFDNVNVLTSEDDNCCDYDFESDLVN